MTAAEFACDGNPSASLKASLVKKINPDGSKTLYVAGIYEVNKSSGGTVTGTKTYYPAGGAMRVNSTLYFVLKDHLGSASVVTDSTGTTVGEDRFYPFGETRFTTGTMFTDKLFTGQREMAGLGIYHYGARFYSPKLGRFLSADTLVPGAGNPQNLNRYSYVMNNPLRYIDLTGHKYCDNQQPDDCTRFSQSYEHTTIKLRIRFKGNGGKGDKEAFVNAMSQEADRMYDAYCQNQPSCEFASPADLYVATHGTTVITFSSSSLEKFCERNTNAGEEGIICGSNSTGKITSILAAHELGHWFNHLVNKNGYPLDDPYHDLANERRNNPEFPKIDQAITKGYGDANCCDNNEDFANMYSMWVFDQWPDPAVDTQRRNFMNNHMYTWILRMLNP